MNISNNITAPCLLIFIMLALILFQSVFFKSESVIFNEPINPTNSTNSEGSEESSDLSNLSEASELPESYESSVITGKYIVYNNTKYKPDRFFILTIISHVCVFIMPAVFYVKLKGAGYSKKLKLELPKLKYISLAIYMFLMLIAGTILINSLVYYMNGFNAAVENASTPYIDTGENPIYAMGVMLSFVFFPAVCEEFVFRSVLSAEYEKYGALCAALMTSAAFAISHFSPVLFPSYFFASMIFYGLARVSNSVVFPVILHAGYNFYNIYIWDKLAGVLKFEQNRFIFIFLVTVCFMISIYFVFNRLEKIYYDKAYKPEKPVKSVKAKQPIKSIQSKESTEYENAGKSRNNKNNIIRNNKGIIEEDANFFIKFSRSVLSPTFIAAIIIFFIYINIL